MPNQGHSFELPAGLQLSQLMQQVWSEQFAAIQQAIRLFGRQGIQAVDLNRWQSALLRRLMPIARVLINQGRDSLQTHSSRKHVKRGAAVQLMPGTITEPPTGQVNEYIEVFDPRVAEFARTWAYDFAQSTLQTSQFNIFDAYKMTGQSLAYGLEDGQTLDQLTQAIGVIFNDPYRAGMIAASEASRLFHGGQIISAKESGEVEGKTWLASSDACDACLELNGKTVPLDQPFIVKEGRYGVVMHPPLHPWCVLGETPVRMSSLIAATNAKYDGPIVRIHFSDGSSVGITPNHMLLSSFGFLRASDFMTGDDVICTGNGELVPTNPNNNYTPSTAHQVFQSLIESGSVTACSVPISPEYLHGDAALCNSNINVVRPDSFLGYTDNTSFSQPLDHLPFVLADMFKSARFDCGGNLTTQLKRLLFATDGSIGRSRELLALLRGKSRVTEKLGLTAASDFEANLFKSTNNARSTDAEALRYVQDTFPGMITRLKVIKIDNTFVHDTPVYDFQTAETMYLVGNGIVSSNCMCSLLYEMLPLGAEVGQLAIAA